MSGTKLTPAVEEYLAGIRQVRASGGSTPELSYYPALSEFVHDRAYWRNVPAAVSNYKLGGYQVLKKWLSYRERKVLLPEDVQHFRDTAQQIAGMQVMVNGGLPQWPEE